MKNTPTAYRWLFSPGTAAALVVAAAVALAVSQTRVVHDWVAMLHPLWPAWAWWLAAAGVELAILSTGLVLANTGRRVLWAWEAGLVAASVAIGVDVSCRCLPEWARALVGGAMALQYLAVITAGHYLMAEHTDDAVAVTATRSRTSNRSATSSAAGISVGHPYEYPADHMHSTVKVPANGHVGAGMAKYVAALGVVGEDDDDVCAHLNISPRTCRRYRKEWARIRERRAT